MNIRHSCPHLGYCKCHSTNLVTDNDLYNTDFVYDFRLFAKNLMIKPCDWINWVSDTYRDLEGIILDSNGEEIFLDIDWLDMPYAREWFRDYICGIIPRRAQRVRPESRERVRSLATLLRARFPKETAMWGIRAANDNHKIIKTIT